MNGYTANSIPHQPYGSKYADAIVPQGDGTFIKVPKAQLKVTVYRPSTRLFQASKFPSAFFQNTNSALVTINRRDFKSIQRVRFLIVLNIANAGNPTAITTLCPTWGMFATNTINLNGGTVNANVMTPLSKLAYYMTTLDTNDMNPTLIDYNQSTDPSGFFVNPGPGFPVGNTPQLIYDMDETFLQSQFGLSMEHARYDLVFTVIPFNPPTGPVLSVVTPGPNGGTAIANTTSVVTVVSLNVQLDVVDLIPQDIQIENADSRRSQMNYYLDKYDLRPTNISMSPGQITTIPLTGLGGQISFIDVFIYATTTNVMVGPNGTFGVITNLLSMGDNSIFDLQGGDKISRLSGSGGVTGIYLLTKRAAEQAPNNLLQSLPAVYRIVFGKMALAYKGVRDGLLELSDVNSFNLLITPVQAVQEVQIVTKTTAAAYNAGTIQFEFDGKRSDPVLFSAATGVLNAAVNNLPWFLANSATASFAGPFTGTGQTILITFTTPRTNGLNRKLLKIVGIGCATGSAVLDNPVITPSVFGVCGLLTTTSVDVVISGAAFWDARSINDMLYFNKLDPRVLEMEESLALVAAEQNTLDPYGQLNDIRSAIVRKSR